MGFSARILCQDRNGRVAHERCFFYGRKLLLQYKLYTHVTSQLVPWISDNPLQRARHFSGPSRYDGYCTHTVYSGTLMI